MSTKPKNRKKLPIRAGFTMVEIMIVIVIVGLLSAMVGPSMYGYLQSHRLQTGTDRMVMDIQYARSQAISRGRVMRMSTTEGGYTVIDPLDGSVLRQQVLDDGVTLGIPQQANFYPWGMSDTRVFDISNTRGAKQISLLPTGIVEVH